MWGGRCQRAAARPTHPLFRDRVRPYSWRGEQLFEGAAGGLLVEEALVARVLEKAAHEVGHAGDEVADRAVGADAQAPGSERVLEVVAEAAEHLDLDVCVLAADGAVGGDGVGDRAQVVAGDGDAYG